MIWCAVVMVAALDLPVHEAGNFGLINVRSTHGHLGPTRSEDKLAPGDTLGLTFDVQGIMVDQDGKVHYSIGEEVTDKAGQTIFKQDPQKAEGTVSLGGNRIPAYAELRLGLNQAPGDFVLKVTVTDTTSGKSQTLTRPFTVLPKGLAVVNLRTTADQDGILPIGAPVVGQPLWLSFGVVGFARDKTTGQPSVQVESCVLDENGKPTCRMLSTTVDKGVPSTLVGLPIQKLVSPNRPGQFTADLRVKDNLTGQTARLAFPFKVIEVK